jgi:CBS domain-containing protein/sporulation protein YlmC with PRC-barrel domain
MAATLSLSEMIGLPVYDPNGRVGRVRELAVVPPEDPVRVSALVVRTRQGDRLLAGDGLRSVNGGINSILPLSEWNDFTSSEGMLLLGRDLLDQQIIDVNGRKVVRVNDVELAREDTPERVQLKIAFVDAGPRGALRRLCKNIIPRHRLAHFLERVPVRFIPWDFVNLIETDPARRVRLKISGERLEKLHPADIADIIEDLAPAEREAVFQTLAEGVAAETLEEIDPKMQVSLVNSMDSDKAADIVEEMDPDAAADLLGDLTPERSEEILHEMEPEERQDVQDLLEFEEDTAAGRMTTEYMSLPPTARVADAIEMMRGFEGDLASMSTIFLVGEGEKLQGAVPLSQLVMASTDTELQTLTMEPLIFCSHEADENEVAEIFDKYNLLTLPVVDENGSLTGVITADDVISILRDKL